MNDLIVMVQQTGRDPVAKAADRSERNLTVWLRRRRRAAAAGSLLPIFRDSLNVVPDWRSPESPRMEYDAARVTFHLQCGSPVLPPQEAGAPDAEQASAISQHRAARLAGDKGNCGVQEGHSRPRPAGVGGFDSDLVHLPLPPSRISLIRAVLIQGHIEPPRTSPATVALYQQRRCGFVALRCRCPGASAKAGWRAG
jgi:hypothetical protein